MKVAVIIPTYNEAGGIGGLLRALGGVFASYPNYDWQVLVVDANSPDNTAGVVRKYAENDPRMHVLVETEKRGIGAAYAAGFAHAIKNMSTDILISFDGDGQHNPQDIPRLMAEIDGGYDYVIGSRYIHGGAVPKKWAPYRKIISRFGSLYARLVLEFPVRDATSGLRAMRVRGFAEHLPLRPEQMVSRQYAYIFHYLHEMLRLGANVREIPIVFLLREHDTSKNTWFDIIESLRVIGILRLRTFWQWRLLRVVLIGGIGFFIQTGIFELLGFVFAVVRPSTAVIIGGEAAILSNFFLNGRFSFKDMAERSGSLFTRLVRFHTVALSSVALQWIFVRTAEVLVGYNRPLLWAAYIAAVILGLGVTYSGYYFWVWRKEK